MVKNQLLEMKEDDYSNYRLISPCVPFMILTLGWQRLQKLIHQKQVRPINLGLKVNTGRFTRSLLIYMSALLLFVYTILMKSHSDCLLATVQFPMGTVTT